MERKRFVNYEENESKAGGDKKDSGDMQLKSSAPPKEIKDG